MKKGFVIAGILGATALLATPTIMRAASASQNFEFTVGLGRVHKVMGTQIRVVLPITLYNRTGFNVTIERLRFTIRYKDAAGTMQLLTLIPQVIESLAIPTDKNTPVAIDVDIDATLITKLNENTVIEMQVDFDYKGLPVNIKQSAKLSDYVPAQAFTIIKAGGNWVSNILNSFGLKGLGCSCCNAQQQLSMGGYSQNYSSLL
ncbi:MAG: hypothetical protein F9K23_15860 [Bacteroidetes bacterium]|nr:MAG: hypothetical protein F9K23_15860 [Bacteroidota bacterium]